MATRSFIIRQSNNPEAGPRYTGIYCHWDGYPSYVGVMSTVWVILSPYLLRFINVSDFWTNSV